MLHFVFILEKGDVTIKWLHGCLLRVTCLCLVDSHPSQYKSYSHYISVNIIYLYSLHSRYGTVYDLFFRNTHLHKVKENPEKNVIFVNDRMRLMLNHTQEYRLNLYYGGQHYDESQPAKSARGNPTGMR